MSKIKLNEKWMEEQYRDGKTIYEIAEVAGCSGTTIWQRLKTLGVATRPKGPSPRRIEIDEEWLRRQYLTLDRTVKEIANELGYNLQIVHGNLRRYGIPRRKAVIRDDKIRSNYLKSDEFHTVHRLRGAMIWLFGKKCELTDCKYDRFVDVHHIEGKGYRDKSGRRHTHNRISGSVLLCPNHHREADHDLISIETLREIIKTRKLKT